MAKEVYEVNMKHGPRELLQLALLIILGLAVRIVIPLASDFPLNDGGLFYQMIADLQANNYALPLFINYNTGDIPFAYPPFAFYLYGILEEVTGISLLTLMRLLPAIISTSAIPVFYLLARSILDNQRASLYATLTFTLTPRAFDWLIMGGGITRSLGFLFAITAIYHINLLFSNPSNRRPLYFSILFSASVLLAHPEAAVHTAIAAIFLYLWKSRTRTGMLHAAIAAAGALILSAPWWATVLMRHGLSPFQAAMNAAGENSTDFIPRIFMLVKFDFTDEPYMQWIAVIGLVGLFTLLSLRKPALPIWLILIALIEPRGGTLYMMLPLSLITGIAFNRVLHPALNPLRDQSPTRAWNILVGFFIFYGTINAFTASSTTGKLSLTSSDRQALVWVKLNTPANAQFAIVSGRLPLNDAVSEWFPVLAERQSTATVFGYEWVNDGNFNSRVQAHETLQSCADTGISCLEEWAAPRHISFVLIHENQKSILAEQLENSPNYKEIYRQDNIILFEKIQ